MANKDTPIINILTYNLPYDLANQIYNEYQNRLKEANYFIDNVVSYKNLQDSRKTVELLLALSIFHKRVIANLDAAVKFYGTVTRHSQATTIKMGSYDLTGDERNKILGVVMSYNQLIQRFSIPSTIMDYYETKEFLKKIIWLKSQFTDAASQKTKRKGNRKDDSEDFPF